MIKLVKQIEARDFVEQKEALGNFETVRDVINEIEDYNDIDDACCVMQNSKTNAAIVFEEEAYIVAGSEDEIAEFIGIATSEYGLDIGD